MSSYARSSSTDTSSAAAEALLRPEPYVSRVGKLCGSMMNFDHLVRNGVTSLKSDPDGKLAAIAREQGRGTAASTSSVHHHHDGVVTSPKKGPTISASQIAERLFDDDVKQRFSHAGGASSALSTDWGRHTLLCSSPRFSKTHAHELVKVVESEKSSKFFRQFKNNKNNNNGVDGDDDDDDEDGMANNPCCWCRYWYRAS
eukprot:PhM_4_TR5236/c4_g3_i1/m.743